MFMYSLPKIPQVSVEIKPNISKNNCSRRKTREQEKFKKKLSVDVNKQSVLNSPSQCLEKSHKF